MRAISTFGALVVHQEVDDVALVVQPDHLAVLAADVDDSAYSGVQEIGPLGVAGDLSDGAVSGLDGGAAVAGGNSGGDILPGQSRLGQRLLQRPLSSGRGSRPGGQDHARHQLPVPV